MAITDWPEDDRPREKLLSKGAGALSEAELLAIFLRTGMQGKSAVDLARELLKRFENLSGIFSASQNSFCDVPGMGPAKYAQLQAVLEMAKRALEEKLREPHLLNSPQAVRDYLRLTLQAKHHEVFLGIFLDAQHRVIEVEELSTGTLTQTSVYPREVAKRALHHNAAAIIFAHNHPSGVAEASRADEDLTRALKAALKLIDVSVLDHFIVGSGEVLSFAERGLL